MIFLIFNNENDFKISKKRGAISHRSCSHNLIVCWCRIHIATTQSVKVNILLLRLLILYLYTISQHRLLRMQVYYAGQVWLLRLPRHFQQIAIGPLRSTRQVVGRLYFSRIAGSGDHQGRRKVTHIHNHSVQIKNNNTYM
jgi:hypothetical protein